MTRASALALSLLSAFAILAVSTLANAADPQFCDVYANKAFKSAKQNQQFSCGFQGPRWLLDKNGHRIWCLIVPEATAQGETGARGADRRLHLQLVRQQGHGAGQGKQGKELRVRWPALDRQQARPLRLVRHVQARRGRHEGRDQSPQDHVAGVLADARAQPSARLAEAE